MGSSKRCPWSMGSIFSRQPSQELILDIGESRRNKGKRRKSEVSSRRVTAVMNAAAYQSNVAELNTPRMRNEQDTILFWEQKANSSSRHTLAVHSECSLRRHNSIRRHSEALKDSDDAPRLSEPTLVTESNEKESINEDPPRSISSRE